MFKHGDKIALVANSNPVGIENEKEINNLLEVIEEMGLESVMSPIVYQETSGEIRANQLNQLYANEDIKGIFDISGGDLANECLLYLDYELIKKHPKLFLGYSDLTTVLNTIYQQTKQVCYLYQIRNLVWEESTRQIAYFKNYFLAEEGAANQLPVWEFKRGEIIEGIVLGGNIRCFLKLAGTPYFPNLTNKVLFLESYSGNQAKIKTFLAQLEQLGVFSQVSGLLLGTFTELESECGTEAPVNLLMPFVERYNLPLARTADIGHGNDSYALAIGEAIYLEKE